MSELKHAPGPWSQSHREDCEGMYNTQVYDSSGVTIATLAWYPYKIGTTTYTLRKQNAKLIAAAPELLEALEAMLSRFGSTDAGFFKADHVKQMAREAIKKATE